MDEKNGRPKLYEELDEIKGMVREVHQVLLGIPHTDEKGLCGSVNNLASNLNELSKSHYALKRTVYVLIAFLIGSGVITGTVVGFLK